MKTLNVMNAEDQNIYLVIDGQDIKVNAGEVVQIKTNARFGSEDFYVDGDCDDLWKAIQKGDNVILSLKTSNDYGWNSFKSKDGATEQEILE